MTEKIDLAQLWNDIVAARKEAGNRLCQALGWAMWPAHWLDVLAIEPEHSTPDWTKPEENDERMWVPGAWPNWYHFMSFEFRLGG